MRGLGGGCCASMFAHFTGVDWAVMASQSSKLGNANQFRTTHINAVAADLNIHEPPRPRLLN
jgi:hypothetical protein